jgi:hypothetical protein
MFQHWTIFAGDGTVAHGALAGFFRQLRPPCLYNINKINTLVTGSRNGRTSGIWPQKTGLPLQLGTLFAKVI